VDIEKHIGYTRGNTGRIEREIRKQKNRENVPTRNKRNQFGVQQPSWNGKNVRMDAQSAEARIHASKLVDGAAVDEDAILEKREILAVDYTKKARRLRKAMTDNKSQFRGCRSPSKRKMMSQFKRDFASDLLKSKTNQWQTGRTRRLLSHQTEKQHRAVDVRKKNDPQGLSQKNKRAARTANMWSRASYD